MNSNEGIIIQCRSKSERYPDKILKKINNKTILDILIERLKNKNFNYKIILATTKDILDDRIVKIAKKNGILFYRGSSSNVLERYYQAAKKYKLKTIIRVTSDCPFIDAKFVNDFVKKFRKENVDYLSNTINPTYPDGLDLEVFNFKSLKLAHLNTKKKIDKEHVTPYLKRSKFIKKFSIENKTNFSHLRITLDYPEDLELIKTILKYFKYNFKIELKKILLLFKKKPEIQKINNKFTRNDGINMSSGYKKWIVAKQYIPGGNNFFSKRPELYLPNLWPTYYSKAKGCKIWDNEKKSYYDFSLMGVGPHLLGYSNSKINKSVIKTIKDGNMSTLNHLNDINLAKKLIELHPWASQVKFAKTGGEANSIAIRIARAASKKSMVLASGYHGWHDWYLSAKKSAKNKFNFFLPDYIKTSGIPKNSSKNIDLFIPNNFKDFYKTYNKNKKNIGTVKIEIARNEYPKVSFLKKIRSFCNKNNLILIFDECTTGFRENLGGLHMKYKIFPDMCIFGKAIANGFPQTAIIGKKCIMESANDTFISSTFWSDSIGVTAALSTIAEMKNFNFKKEIVNKGILIKKNWRRIFKKYKFKVKIKGINSMPNFIFKDNHAQFKSFLIYEMLNKGFLTSNSIYICKDHNEKLIKKYLDNFEKSIKKLNSLIKNKKFNNFIKNIKTPDLQIGRN